MSGCKAVLMLAAALAAVPMKAQTQKKADLDLGITFAAQRSFNAGTGQPFWMTGGQAELGASLWHGLGAALSVSGTHTNSIAASGIPLSFVVWTAGPRYRWHGGHRVSAYGEVMAGEANGFHSLFPAPGAAQSNANGLAFRAGLGVDLAVKKHFAIRALEASYLRTQLPNADNNVQNILQLGAGVVFRFH
ncbi:MAG: outer membrane beta-barrel protein [Acidobacteriaceae bacterium]|nr:outer membrane beta-barrel protein [Acidobacteriaceae bacterium]